VAGPRDHQSSPFLEEIAPTICRFDFVALCVASSAGFRHLPRKTRIVLRATLSSTGYDGLGVAPFTPRVPPPAVKPADDSCGLRSLRLFAPGQVVR
jgi:hypothetical protein